MHFVLAIAGLIIGSMLGRHGGWVYGMLAGFAIGAWINTDNKVKKLQEELSNLKNSINSFTEVKTEKEETTTQSIHQEIVTESKHTQTKDPVAIKTVIEKQLDEPVKSSETTKPVPVATNNDWSEEPYIPAALPQPVEAAIDWVKHFFTTGNIIVKVGVTVLFFGLAFLVKYAAERSVFPIELRLAGIAIIGIIMLGIGWRLRNKKTAYALVLQGGALAVLYLTVFSALRLYDLLPPTFAFAILFIFAAFSAALAVLQNSRALAVLTLSGGFLAPILTSTGSGNYVALFSYYLVLNFGIFGIAWFKSWRLLNVLGFLFTFVVATAWGVNSYTPTDFSKAEPFLIAFYLLYVAISVLFAIRQPVQLKGYVDSTLIFGVPIVGFGLQAGMVNHIEYALAWSSIILAAFYIGLASILWQRLTSEFRLICEAFLALGVMFATLAVPFALDATWTSGTWALEGAAAVWVGTRQSRLLPRLLGYALQLASAYTYFSSITYSSGDPLFILNGNYIGALIISLSGLFVAWQLKVNINKSTSGKHRLIPQEQSLSVPFLAWGLIWWVGAGINEIDHNISSVNSAFSLILFASFTAVTLQWLKQKLNWDELRLPALTLLPVLYLLIPFVLLENDHPFADWNVISWTLAFTSHLWILKKYDAQETNHTHWLHTAGFWFITAIITIELAWQVDHYVQGANTWPLMMTGLIPTLFILFIYHYGQKIAWPVAQHKNQYQAVAVKPVALGIWIWFALMNIFNDGRATPIDYLPFINPLDIVLAIQLLALTYWQRLPLDFEDWGKQRWRFDYSKLLLAISVFLWLNTMWLRFAHHMWHIDFNLSDMTQSRLVQTGVAILWSITGLSCMIMGARKKMRSIWIAGAIVMAAVVVKLFMFDLANTGTVERIVSFMSVGLLLLVVGYFSPVPPAGKEEDDKETKDEA